ncbi:MAG TPA: M36 family metallopeptidase [candidate division Zixibacteria bacterium]|nr:M36 family metallopeptidase [candidate division Zixibacteria bacterium]
MRKVRRGFSPLLLLAFVVTLAAAPGSVLARPSGPPFLTGPAQGDAVDVVVNYLRANHAKYGLKQVDVQDVIVTDRYTSDHNGVTHVYLRQAHRGIGVVGAAVNANVAADGSIISLNSSFIPDLHAKVRGAAARSAEASVRAVARGLGLHPPASLKVLQHRGGPAAGVVFDRNGISLEPITAKLVYQPAGDVVKLAWQIELYEPDADHWWNLRVDATTGQELARDDYVSHADETYSVFPIPTENPEEAGGVRTTVTNPATDASPLGWVTAGQTLTMGNNVLAYTDRDADNVPDQDGFADGGPDLVFDPPLDLTRPPVEYQDAAVTNLFYWNNVIHDVTYAYGFDEKAGNFQENNFAPQNGKGGDPVRAEAQDGSGRNNANFATPPDGFRPRMQMFEWRDSAPNPLTVEAPTGPLTVSGPMAGFGASLATTGPISGTLMVVDDGTAPTSDGCQSFSLPGAPGSVIPLIDRGACTFTQKVKNAQNAGALAAVVVDNVPGEAPFGMGGSDPSITIPSIMISFEDGQTVRALLPAAATLAPNPDLKPDRDSDLDSGVIIHEYGHGVSNRLTGGPGTVNCLNNAEQMGEGWSDFLALVLTAQAGDEDIARGIGNYVIFEDATGVGIRPTPYSRDMAVNPTTYQTVIDEAGTTLTVPHGVGYAWATMLWEMYGALVDEYGFSGDIYADWTAGGNNLALQLVIDGMKFQPCQPGFVQGRDAILQADQALTGGVNQCLIWEAFAKRGLGFSASQGSPMKVNDGRAAFDLPVGCGGGSAGVVLPLVPAALLAGFERLRLRRTAIRR